MVCFRTKVGIGSAAELLSGSCRTELVTSSTESLPAAQPTKGYLRRLGMRGPRRQVQFVLRRQGQTYPGQHRVGATAVQPPGVHCTIAYRSRVIRFPTGDYRRGPEAAGVHTTQDIPRDVLYASLLKDFAEIFARAITTLANLSLQTRNFSARFKSAQVLPLPKKAGLDRSLPVNYRPISYLTYRQSPRCSRD